jgi:hypothetical protein
LVLLGKGSFSYVGNVPALEKLLLSSSEKKPRLKWLAKQFEHPMTIEYLLGKAYPILLNVL